MKIQLVLRMVFMSLVVYQAISLPIEKELLRVKRKGEQEENDGGQRLRKRDLELFKVIESLEDDVEVRRKRRFHSEDIQDNQEIDKYPNKMAARSSRSSREDNDITARGVERFLIRDTKRKGIKQPAKITSGSGMESEDSSSGSASGIGKHDSEAQTISTNGRYTQASSLENIVAALSDEPNNHGGEFETSSGSGLWGSSGSDDDLPKFFSAAASNSHYMEVGRVASGSGSGGSSTKQATLVSDLAEELHQQTTTKQDEQAHTKQKRSSETFGLERDILHEFFEGPGIIHRSKREKIDNSIEEKLASFFRDLKGDTMANHEPETPNEPPPIPAVVASKRKSKVTKTARVVSSSHENSEGLTGINLVKRFYKDQDMGEGKKQLAKIYPDSVAPIDDIPTAKKDKVETKPLHIEKKKKKDNDKQDSKKNKVNEPRVVHQKEIPRTHVTIIEEPAIYSRTDNEMDSSNGDGNNVEDDESEPAIEIHERDIREDGYVGCYADQSPDRDLPIPLSVRNLTPKNCRLACKDAGHAYAGLQYGYLCRCGDNYGKYQRLDESQCNTACKGDKTQICGGFFRSSIYATEGVTEPTRGNFLHVESVRPLNTPIKPQSATPNFMPPVMPPRQPYLQRNPLSYSSSAHQLRPSYIAPEEPKIIYHSETPLQDLPVTSFVQAEVIKVPQPGNNVGLSNTMSPARKSTIVKPSTPKPPASIRQHYMHKQHGAAPIKKFKINYFKHLITNPATQIYTGSIKLKQSWLDGLTSPDSPEYKILSGNIEEAFKKMFKKDPKFITAKVHGFSKGLVKHNPSTIRKVVASFSLTFQRGTNDVEHQVLRGVQDTGKLFDMPAYKKSIKIQEYHRIAETRSQAVKIEKKRDTIQEIKSNNVPYPNLPYTLELFLMKDQMNKQKRSVHE